MSLGSNPVRRYDHGIETDRKRIPWISSSTGLPARAQRHEAPSPRYRDQRPNAPRQPLFHSNRRDDADHGRDHNRRRPFHSSGHNDRDRERERERDFRARERQMSSRHGRSTNNDRPSDYSRRRGGSSSKSPSPTPQAREHSRLVAEEQRTAVLSRPDHRVARTPSPLSTRPAPTFDFNGAASLRRQLSESEAILESLCDAPQTETASVAVESPPPIGNSPPPPLPLFHPEHMKSGSNDIFSQSQDVATVLAVDSAPAWAELQVYGSTIDEELCYQNDEEVLTYADGTMVVYYQVKRDTTADNPKFWAKRAVYYNPQKIATETRFDIHFTAADMGPGHVLFSGAPG